MDEDNEFNTLPDNSEEAFAVLHKRKMKEVELAYEENRGGRWMERAYVDCMISFDDVHGLDILSDLKNPPIEDRDFDPYFANFRRHCEMTAMKVLMEAARRTKSGVNTVVSLSHPSKAAIHRLIGEIRVQIYAINISDELRHSLLAKLNAFAAEVDKDKTSTQALYAGMIEASRAIREASDELQPVFDRLDRISKWIEKADKIADKLLPWRDRRQIEKPQARIEDKRSSRGSPAFDDDVPF
ncbi:hypothetical protein [Methylobacterium sp. 37f]|uniref:hypothetical protein n=1 Tax=Methylobacterium sp. 37f TaxID=2817058 RepID=UPI001FFC7274|nr:hypothetical protein [Methylobacterium sp. 37f]MCK2054753.1 hypothetical protein [Methylobacterium sp. 37f]